MTIDATFVRMIGRNLAYFDEMFSDPDSVSFDAVDEQRENLYRALDFGLRLPETNYQAAQVIDKCATYIEQRCNYRHWAKLMTKLANKYDAEDSALLCRMLGRVGYLHYGSGDNQRAIHAYQVAEKVALTREDDLSVANAWYFIAVMLFSQRAFAQTVSRTEETISIFEAQSKLTKNDQKILGFTYNLHGLAHIELSNYAHAHDSLQQSLALLSALDEQHYKVIPLSAIAQLHKAEGDEATAASIFSDLLKMCRENGWTMYEVRLLLSLIKLRSNEYDWESAYQLCQEIETTELRKRGKIRVLAAVLTSMGYVLLHCRKLEKALAFAKEAVNLWEQLNFPLPYAEALCNLGCIYENLKEYNLAIQTYTKVGEALAEANSSQRTLTLSLKASNAINHLQTLVQKKKL